MNIISLTDHETGSAVLIVVAKINSISRSASNEWTNIILDGGSECVLESVNVVLDKLREHGAS